MNAIAEIQEKHTGSPLVGSVNGEAEALRALQEKRTVAKERSTELFEMERNEKWLCREQIELFDHEIKRLRLRQFLFARRCRVLLREAFELRNQQGLPSVALFTTESHFSQIYLGSVSGQLAFNPKLPDRYLSAYDDVERKMQCEVAGIRHKAKRRAWVSLLALLVISALLLGQYKTGYFTGDFKSLVSGIVGAIAGGFFLLRFLQNATMSDFTLCHQVRWNGLIPSEARKIINELRALGAQVFLLAEVTEWGKIIASDPLILAEEGGFLYVAGSFNTTSLEKNLNLEYTERPHQ